MAMSGINWTAILPMQVMSCQLIRCHFMNGYNE